MVFPTSLQIHTATIRHATGTYTTDAYGNQVPVTADTSVKCRFSQGKEKIVVNGAVSYLESIPKILLRPDAVIADNDKIISIIDGFTGTYTAYNRKVIYEAAVANISHITCQLAAVV